MKTLSLLAAIASLMHTPAGAAQTADNKPVFYISPLVNGVRTDDARLAENDSAITLAAGFEVLPSWNLELSLFRGHFEAANDRLEMDGVGIDALRVFRRDARVAPYLLVGAGSLDKDRVSGGSANNAYADAGGGLFVSLRGSRESGRQLSLRADLRARHDDADEGSRVDRLLGLGLQFAFGSATRPAAAPAPAAAAPAAPPPVADEDDDGIPDERDRCPGTPRNAAVDTNGCELDADGDGIVDRMDACPGTPPRQRTDARGCQLADVLELPFVTFEYDSARLRPEAFATLDEAVVTLQRNPDLRIEVAGYTDSTGSDAYNEALSQRRAETVHRYLVERGVTNTLTARGYGERDPIADNGTEQERAQNRRVVLRIVQ